MSDSLLHQMIKKAVPAPAPPPSMPIPPPRRTSVRGGRFARWHVGVDAPPEEEGWMMTYLDVITLLLMMMVVMLVFSEPNKSHVGGDREKERSQATAVAGVQSQGQGAQNADRLIPLPIPGVASAPGQGRSPKSPAKDVPDRLTDVPLGSFGNDIKVTVGPRSVSFRISSELLFSSGEAQLTPAGQKVVDQLLPVFNKAPDYTVAVEGHTDNMPIQTERFPSNWELAAGRAGSVVRHLQNRGLNPTRLRATGYADTHPLASNATPQGRSSNRRVEITLMAPQPSTEP